MTPAADHHNMNNDIHNWTFWTMLSGLFSAAYNGFVAFMTGLQTWGVHEWVAVISLLVVILSALVNRHYNRLREKREAEKHEWERELSQLELKRLREAHE